MTDNRKLINAYLPGVPALILKYLALFLLIAAFPFFFSGPAGAEKTVVPLEDIVGVWDFDHISRDGTPVFSAEDSEVSDGKRMIEFTSDGLWILTGGEQTEVYDILPIRDNVLPDGSSVIGDMLSITVPSSPGTAMIYTRSSLPGWEASSMVDESILGEWNFCRWVQYRDDGTVVSDLRAENCPEEMRGSLPVLEVRKAGFAIMNYENAEPGIYPVNDHWRLINDLLVYVEKRDEDDVEAWFFSRPVDLPQEEGSYD